MTTAGATTGAGRTVFPAGADAAGAAAVLDAEEPAEPAELPPPDSADWLLLTILAKFVVAVFMALLAASTMEVQAVDMGLLPV